MVTGTSSISSVPLRNLALAAFKGRLEKERREAEEIKQQAKREEYRRLVEKLVTFLGGYIHWLDTDALERAEKFLAITGVSLNADEVEATIDDVRFTCAWRPTSMTYCLQAHYDGRVSFVADLADLGRMFYVEDTYMDEAKS